MPWLYHHRTVLLELQQIWQCTRHCIKLAYLLRNQHLPPEKHPRIRAIPWWHEVSNANDILTSQACTPNSSLIWFGHVYRMVGRTLKDIFLRRTGRWEMDHWPPSTEISECLQEGHKSVGHWYRVPGMPWIWPHKVEKYPESKTPVRRGEADEGRGQRQTRGHAEKGAATPLDQRPRTSVTFEAVTFTLTCVAAWIGGRFAEGMWWPKFLTASSFTSRDGSDAKYTKYNNLASFAGYRHYYINRSLSPQKTLLQLSRQPDWLTRIHHPW